MCMPSTDIVKAVIGAIAGVLFGILIAPGTVAVVAIGLGIAVGIFVSRRLNDLDSEYEITKSIIKYLEHKEKKISKTLVDELHNVYLITTEKIILAIKITAKKELNNIVNEVLRPW
ncbi:hypothetical protein [Rheinheimera sp. MMS21-TC3]|uniref:hypothetical protein n=1 Tax=Rheinheimera sp. MMS21-TC3 TaxID=3072790 RepID=UPI0028C48EFA|nr:hypothetical protein [Rheinheimera sp. MMS21-TC3]WNO61018.1 hypothetical protein RDV63_08655 [Rheinheimera sp. MMS21-TC3]